MTIITTERFKDINLVIDYADNSFICKKFVSEGDINGRSLTIQITNGGLYGQLLGASLNAVWTNLSNGISDITSFDLIDEANTIFRLNYPTHMLTAGKVEMSIQIVYDGTITQMKKFDITVQEINGNFLPVIKSQEFSALTAALSRISKYDTAISKNKMDIAGKVDKGGNEQVSLGMLSQEVKEAMTGGSLAVVGENSVNTKNIVEQAVTNEKIRASSIEGGKLKNAQKTLETENLFDKDNVTTNYYVHELNGKEIFVEGSTLFCSGYIKVQKNQVITVKELLTHSGAWFDESKKYVGSIGDKNSLITELVAPRDGYLRWNGDASHGYSIETAMIMNGKESSWPVGYVPFGDFYDIDWLNAYKATESGNINPDSVFGVDLVNLFDKDHVIDKKAINNVGVIYENEALSLYGPFPINPTQKYTLSVGFKLAGAWLDKDKKYITKINASDDTSNPKNVVIAPPSAARYAMVNCYTSSDIFGVGKDTFMFLAGEHKETEQYISHGVVPRWFDKRSLSPSPYVSKKIVTFGDSVTWYDQKKAHPKFKDPDTTMVGYQSYIRNSLGCIVDNQGVSGDTTQQIYARSKNFDYTGYDLVTFMCGTNNFRDNPDVNFGEIEAIGGEYDVTTFCGAYQAMLEDVFVRFPHIKIVLITPYKSWSTLYGLMPTKFKEVILQFGKLYGIPVCNLYDKVQINTLNKEYYFADDPEQLPYYFHVNNLGYKLVADKLVPFLKDNLVEEII